MRVAVPRDVEDVDTVHAAGPDARWAEPGRDLLGAGLEPRERVRPRASDDPYGHPAAGS